MAIASACKTLGHVLVTGDPECLVCQTVTVQGDKVRITIELPGPVDDLPGGIAQIDGPDSWGHAGL